MLSTGNIKENFRLYGRPLLQLKVRGRSRISKGEGAGEGSANGYTYSFIWSARDVYIRGSFLFVTSALSTVDLLLSVRRS